MKFPPISSLLWVGTISSFAAPTAASPIANSSLESDILSKSSLGPNIDRESCSLFSFRHDTSLIYEAGFAVKHLPQVKFPIPNSWAGNIPIGNGFGNDSLYFWLWEGGDEADRRGNCESEDLISEFIYTYS